MKEGVDDECQRVRRGSCDFYFLWRRRFTLSPGTTTSPSCADAYSGTPSFITRAPNKPVCLGGNEGEYPKTKNHYSSTTVAALRQQRRMHSELCTLKTAQRFQRCAKKLHTQ